MVLRDNSIIKEGSVKTKHWKQILSLIDIPLSELTDGDNLHVFPHSFKEQKEDLKDLCLFTRFNGDVWTTNLMGFIGIDGQELTICSRFSKKDGEDYFLYYMLMKVMNLNVFNLPHGIGKENAIDLLMLLFPRLLNEALSQGLYKEYRSFEYNDARVRGVIDVDRFIREDIPFQGKVAYRTHEYSYDNKVTQLIRHTIEYMTHHPFGHGILNNDPVTRTSISQIINATPEYSRQKRQSIINANVKIVRHPYFTKYRPLQKLCLQILRHERISYGDSNQKIHGILFDGAWLWEEYVASILRGTFTHYTSENSHFKLFEPEDGNHFQKIIPDYLSNVGDEENGYAAVADAKYMYLHGDKMSAERAVGVYYKTIMYMYRFGSDLGFLFHPLPSDSEEEQIKELAIEGKRKGKLIVAGLKIPKYDISMERQQAFTVFQESMKEKEIEYQKEISVRLSKYAKYST